MVIDEVCPFRGVTIKTLDTELIKERFVKIIDINNRSGILELCPKLSHFKCLLLVI